MRDQQPRTIASTGSVSASVSLHVDNSARGLPESRPLRRPGLRLTDAERQAIREAADAYALNNDDADCERIERTLRGLLDRLSPIASGDNYRPQAIARLAALERLVAMEQELENPIQENATKQENATPAWMSKPFWVDPPSGHRYGFPKLYDPQTDGNMTEWMVRHGYPQHLADKGLACTFTATE